MPPRPTTARAAEFGDFQTPPGLAAAVCQLLRRRCKTVRAIVEPTCGQGGLLVAALRAFPNADRAIGLDVHRPHLRRARRTLLEHGLTQRAELVSADFFGTDWESLLGACPEPLLVIGNPPWVTNAALGTLRSENLPEKRNFHKRRGMEAITGKSNFDISEWMLLRLLEALNGRRAVLAMLCKTAVARKVLAHAWKTGLAAGQPAIYRIDAAGTFGVAVEACLLVCDLRPPRTVPECQVFRHLADERPASTIGHQDGRLIANATAYARLRHLRASGEGKESAYRWRSGIKHDCGKVMELVPEGRKYRNGLGELVALEDRYLFPMLKSSDLAAARVEAPRRRMLVPQSHPGGDTAEIARRAPNTWHYLQSHAALLDHRASSIYRNRPRFSVFGVGEYSFAPWRVAVSGLYKRLAFVVVGSVGHKPIVLDDTCYSIPCQSEPEARSIVSLLDSALARDFYDALIFWDAKRPVTIDVLGELDLRQLAKAVGYALA